jgi:hypothetical protein
MLFGYKTKANFTVENEGDREPPVVDFDSKPAAPAPAKYRPKPCQLTLRLIQHERSGRPADRCLGWLAGAGLVRRRGGRSRRRAAARGARHRPHRHAERRPAARSTKPSSRLRTARGSQIAILLVPTTQPEAIEQYSIRVAEAWKLGRKGTTTASSWSSRRTTASCASRSATASKAP